MYGIILINCKTTMPCRSSKLVNIQNCSSNQMYVEIKNKVHKAAYEALGVKHTSSGRKTEKWRNE